jgi:hypothetical protein
MGHASILAKHAFPSRRTSLVGPVVSQLCLARFVSSLPALGVHKVGAASQARVGMKDEPCLPIQTGSPDDATT